MTTRRGFLCVCGASTAGIFCTGEAGGLVASSGQRASGTFDAVTLMNLAEQMREALATMTPHEEQELRRRYGNG